MAVVDATVTAQVQVHKVTRVAAVTALNIVLDMEFKVDQETTAAAAAADVILIIIQAVAVDQEL